MMRGSGSKLLRRACAFAPGRPLLQARPCSSASSASVAESVSGPLSAYRKASVAFPLSTAFATCFFKGSASDVVAQRQVEKREHMDWRRNFAFAFFSAAYVVALKRWRPHRIKTCAVLFWRRHLGIGQHLIYNVAFTRIFGAGRDLATAMKKVVADSLVHVPLIYLPLYYPYKALVLGEGSALDGLRQYRHDAYEVLTTYWTAWPLVHLTSFTILPVELRVSFVACVSFCWLIFLSYASHKDHGFEHAEQARKD